MKIVIIEDEHYTAKDLENCIRELRTNFEILKVLTSVKESIPYLKTHTDYNLVFSDIQLDDGLSFEIFKSIQLTAPVIFCTAFDNYAIDAFKANGIDYILKPINKVNIQAAIEKYERLVKPASEVNESMQQLLQLFKNTVTEKTHSSLLVHYKDKIIPVRIEDVALFYIENEICRIISFEGKHFSINERLEEIEKICGIHFFRANRQYLVHRKAVSEVAQHFSRKHILKLNFTFPEQIFISKEKSTALFKWLEAI